MPIAALAQRVSGTVRVDSTTLLSGAVVATIDSTGQTIIRTLTSGSGRYSLPRAANATRVRVVRIGFKPVIVPIPATEGDVTVDITMERAPVVLETVKVSSEGSCSNSGNGLVILNAWEQARAALLTAIVAREASPARVRLLEYQRSLDLPRRSIMEQRLNMTSGTATRPVAAARSAAELATSGYLGQSQGDNIYFAPDADVLFDESFSSGHCFGLTRGSRERAGQIGLTFRPRNAKRDFVDVEGTLWLGPQASELLQLDYRYTNLDAEAARAGVGGTMHFRTMANGVVLIDSWSIVVPVMTEVRRSGGLGSATRGVVNYLIESGAYVLDASWADGTHWSDPLGGVRGHVREKTSGAPVQAISVATEGATRETDAAGAFEIVPLPPGRYVVAATDSAFGEFIKPRQQTREVVVGRNDTIGVDFEVPPREAILDEMCRGDRKSDGPVVILGQIMNGSESFPDKVQVAASWYAPVNGSQSLDLHRINQALRTSSVNSTGGFYICGVPRTSSWISLSLVADRTTIIDTLLPPSLVDAPDAANTRRIEWRVPSGLFATALRADPAALSGRVTRNGSPVAGAEVWVVFADTMVKTDSLGRYRAAGLNAGHEIVQVRRIGFAVKRDSVTLKARQETQYDFALDGVELDTVRTIGKGRSYDAPRLQDFERRRLSGMGGHFISEDHLRESDNVQFANVIRSFIPGARIELRGGQAYLKSRTAATIGQPDCFSSVFLDGVLIYDGPGAGKDAPIDLNQFLTSSISGVEFYRGSAGLPLQFRSARPDCGTLLLWTRGK
jgi:hypothetical protein